MAQNNKINGGDVLIKCLLEENVKYMFGIPGGQLLSMYDAIYRWGREEGINTVMFRHEQAAAHAADAWARVTNTPGVCFGTVGPGAMHLIPAIGAEETSAKISTLSLLNHLVLQAYGTGLQPVVLSFSHNLGRCPRLVWIAPLALFSVKICSL